MTTRLTIERVQNGFICTSDTGGKMVATTENDIVLELYRTLNEMIQSQEKNKITVEVKLIYES